MSGRRRNKGQGKKEKAANKRTSVHSVIVRSGVKCKVLFDKCYMLDLNFFFPYTHKHARACALRTALTSVFDPRKATPFPHSSYHFVLTHSQWRTSAIHPLTQPCDAPVGDYVLVKHNSLYRFDRSIRSLFIQQETADTHPQSAANACRPDPEGPVPDAMEEFAARSTHLVGPNRAHRSTASTA